MSTMLSSYVWHKFAVLFFMLGVIMPVFAACGGGKESSPVPLSLPTEMIMPTATPGTATPIFTSTPALVSTMNPLPTSISPGKPAPFFPNQNYSESHSYASSGIITGVTIRIELKNRGNAGDVFIAVAAEESQDLKGSKVFYMDKDESVVVQAHFKVLTHYFQRTFKWEARVASPDDTSQGEIRVIRSNMKRVGQLNIGTVWDIALAGDFAYVLTSHGLSDPGTAPISDISLRVVNISDPHNPR